MEQNVEIRFDARILTSIGWEVDRARQPLGAIVPVVLHAPARGGLLQPEEPKASGPIRHRRGHPARGSRIAEHVGRRPGASGAGAEFDPPLPVARALSRVVAFPEEPQTIALERGSRVFVEARLIHHGRAWLPLPAGEPLGPDVPAVAAVGVIKERERAVGFANRGGLA